MVSAIWHGFYPGFFVFFIGAGFLDYQAKLAGQSLYPYVESWMPGWLVYALSFVWCYIMCGYFATGFILLSWENFHKVYASMGYIGHIALAGAIVLCLILGPAKQKKSSEGAKADTSAAADKITSKDTKKTQ